MTAFDTLADKYELGRIGYSNEIYSALVGWGLQPKHRVLDIGCGTGLSSALLIANGHDVTGVDPSERMLAHARRNFPAADWVTGKAEALPFESGSFDAVISGQALHHTDRVAALNEISRVLKPRGIAGLWWKVLASDNPVRLVCDDAAVELGIASPPRGGLTGGFKEFYARKWAETSLRVIPWRTNVPLARFVQYERSRKVIYELLGDRAEQYFDLVQARLMDTFGDAAALVPLAFTHFLYLART
jgi:ubiquinone/menaquinone biosynthesis C-methylase UbiE